MTALKEYQRLESGGLWRADASAQRRDVVVSFGDATLVIADGAGRPLTHWSLAAVARINPGTRPAIFALDTDAEETLEVDDTLMVDAIEKVRKTVARARPRKGKLRLLVTSALVAGAVALGVLWLPDAMRAQALGVVPMSKRTEIGAILLNHIQGMTGPACRGQLGRQALAQFQRRVLGSGTPGQIVVMPLGQETALPLPGGIIVLDQALVERLDDPAVAAGFVLAADQSRRDTDPLMPLLETARLTDTMRLLATGDVPDTVLTDYAADLISDQAAAAPPEDALLPAFADARVPSTPFGEFRVARGQPVMSLIVEDPFKNEDIEVLPDDLWVSLQGICDS